MLHLMAQVCHCMHYQHQLGTLRSIWFSEYKESNESLNLFGKILVLASIQVLCKRDIHNIYIDDILYDCCVYSGGSSCCIAIVTLSFLNFLQKK